MPTVPTTRAICAGWTASGYSDGKIGFPTRIVHTWREAGHSRDLVGSTQIGEPDRLVAALVVDLRGACHRLIGFHRVREAREHRPALGPGDSKLHGHGRSPTTTSPPQA